MVQANAPGPLTSWPCTRRSLDFRILYSKRLVGANGFEPSTSWSRTRHLNPINALSGVAYGTRSVISPLSVVPTLYLEFGLNPCCERGFLCSLASLLPCCP